MAVIIKSGEANSIQEFHIESKPGFDLHRNVTKSWISAGKPLEGEALKTFCEKFLTENLGKNDLSGGFYIVLESPIKNSRKKPYSVVKNTNDQVRKFTTAYKIVGETTKKLYDTLIGVSQPTAVKKATALCKEHKEGMSVEVIKVCTDGVSVIANVEYTPSSNYKKGSYIIFGRVEGTVVSK